MDDESAPLGVQQMQLSDITNNTICQTASTISFVPKLLHDIDVVSGALAQF